LFSILWCTLLFSVEARADQWFVDGTGVTEGKTYHGHTVETTPPALFTSAIIGADKIGKDTIRVKMNDGRSYDAVMLGCWNLQSAHGYIFGKNWEMDAIFDQLMPGLPVYLLIGNNVEHNPGCVITKIIPVMIVNE